MDRAYVKQLPEYGTDTITMCPLNVLLVHTLRVHNPWIKILFDQMVDVTLVVIYNRQSSFGKNIHIFLTILSKWRIFYVDLKLPCYYFIVYLYI